MSQPWWEQLSEDEVRNPLFAIYEVQVAIDNAESEIEKAQKHLVEYQKRLEFLRGVVRDRMGDAKTT
jgi:hypothetical protein